MLIGVEKIMLIGVYGAIKIIQICTTLIPQESPRTEFVIKPTLYNYL